MNAKVTNILTQSYHQDLVINNSQLVDIKMYTFHKMPTSDDMTLFIFLFASYVQEKVGTGGGRRVRGGGMDWGEAALPGNVHLPNTSHNTV